MPTSILPASIEKLGWPTAGSVHGPRPTPIERQLSIAFCADGLHLARVAAQRRLRRAALPHQDLARHPAALLALLGGAEQTSSLATTVSTSRPSLAAIFTAILTFMLSPA